MTDEKITTVEFEGENYTWDGKYWVVTRTRIRPPIGIVNRLNALIAPALEREDASIEDIQRLLERARKARDAEQLDRAERLIRAVLRIDSEHLLAATILCSILRKRNRPEQALNETNRFKNKNHPYLLTSRAAALCDLGRWEEAKREVARALAIARAGSPEPFNVVNRIKRARPDLYEND